MTNLTERRRGLCVGGLGAGVTARLVVFLQRLNRPTDSSRDRGWRHHLRLNRDNTVITHTEGRQGDWCRIAESINFDTRYGTTAVGHWVTDWLQTCPLTNCFWFDLDMAMSSWSAYHCSHRMKIKAKVGQTGRRRLIVHGYVDTKLGVMMRRTQNIDTARATTSESGSRTEGCCPVVDCQQPPVNMAVTDEVSRWILWRINRNIFITIESKQ